MMGELPILQRTQGERQSGCLLENALVIAEQFRAPQGVDQLPVRPGMNFIFGHSGPANSVRNNFCVAAKSGKLFRFVPQPR